MLRDRRTSRFLLLDTWLQRRDWTAATQAKIERAGLRLRVGEYMLLRVLAAALAALLAFTFASRAGGPALGVVASIPGGAAGMCGPALFLRWRIGRRSTQIESQLVEMCELMASMLSAGFGYLQTLTSASEQLEEPLASELKRLVDAVRIGGDTDEALGAMSERLNSRDFEMVATAITINRATGGDLAGIMRGVASTIRERQSFAREVRALTSRERYSAFIVAGFPMVIAGALTLLMPDTFAVLFTELAGRVILAVAFALDVIGYMAIKRVSKIEV
jgi:tight adherence protein B